LAARHMMPGQRLLAAVDLGSNSFRLLIGRVVDTANGSQVLPLDSLKETVRLASGLTREKRLDADSQERALAVLQRFGERLRSFAPDQVRAVATNTLRVAKNARDFLETAEQALGFPVEVIAGREEARLIYCGVSHTFPAQSGQMLVVDIGGGSTEFIIGQGHEPRLMESLFMGCVSYSLQFFPGGEIDRYTMKQAELAAQKEVEVIARDYVASGWQLAVGSSGTAKALGEILEGNGFSEAGITRAGLDRLRDALLRSGNASRLKLEALKADRIPVLPGGFAIMSAVFSVLGLERMDVAEGALRQGVLYDLLGRSQHHDMRDVTIEQFTQRYGVDRPQAKRVGALALTMLRQAVTGSEEEREAIERCLSWAAALHEIGLSIAHSSYHKHSAYILSNADMPGFSKMEQMKMAALVLGHNGKLTKLSGQLSGDNDWLAVLCLRLAALVYRRRAEMPTPAFRLESIDKGYALHAEADWLAEHPLTEFSLRQECVEWGKVGLTVELA
jgi:exopolyphosphatase/guanosine-5'-triphosphate,3'-diphosphate pyrophosphatase